MHNVPGDTSKTALITGASSGIGYELTKLFARDGFGLVLVARDAPRLEKMADELRRSSNVRTLRTQTATTLRPANTGAFPRPLP